MTYPVIEKRCKYGDPTCPCQDGDPCLYVAIAGTPAMLISPALVDRLIEVHSRAMNSQVQRGHKHAMEVRVDLTGQLTAARAELSAARAQLAGVAAYAHGLASGAPATWPWRHGVRAALNEILYGKG